MDSPPPPGSRGASLHPTTSAPDMMSASEDQRDPEGSGQGNRLALAVRELNLQDLCISEGDHQTISDLRKEIQELQEKLSAREKSIWDLEGIANDLTENVDVRGKQIDVLEHKLEKNDDFLQFTVQRLVEKGHEIEDRDEILAGKNLVIEVLEQSHLSGQQQLEVAWGEIIRQFQDAQYSGVMNMQRRRKMERKIDDLMMALWSSEDRMGDMGEEIEELKCTVRALKGDVNELQGRNHQLEDESWACSFEYSVVLQSADDRIRDMLEAIQALQGSVQFLTRDAEVLQDRNRRLEEDSWARSFEHSVVVTCYLDVYRKLRFLLNRYREMTGNFQKEIDAINSWDGVNL